MRIFPPVFPPPEKGGRRGKKDGRKRGTPVEEPEAALCCRHRRPRPGATGLLSVEEGGAGGRGRLDLDARTGSIASPYHATKLLPFFDHDRPSTSFSTCSMKCLDVAAVLNSHRVPRRQDRYTDNRLGREDPMSRSATSARPHLRHRRPLHHRRRSRSALLTDACMSASGHRGEASLPCSSVEARPSSRDWNEPGVLVGPSVPTVGPRPLRATA
jgi:hypothetical protein